MKKVIILNILIVLVHFPYCFGRWLAIPWMPPDFILDDIMVFGSMAIGGLLFINTILLIIFSFVGKQWKPYSLIFNIILMALTLFYIFYAAIMITWDGQPVWVDIIAALVLYLAFRVNRLELEKS